MKDGLVSNGVGVSMETLRKAILLPEEEEKDPTRKMPDPGLFLMENPFKFVPEAPKKKKKRKKQQSKTLSRLRQELNI